MSISYNGLFNIYCFLYLLLLARFQVITMSAIMPALLTPNFSFLQCSVFVCFALLAGCVSVPDKPIDDDIANMVLPSADDYFADTFANGSQGPQMVRLPAVNYKMGCQVKGDCYDDDKPVRVVSIPSGLALMTKEVTFAQYDTFAKSEGYDLPDDKGWGRGDRPVIYVDWEDATAYAEWLSAQTGKHYQLPTEAVWEYAARAGRSGAYFFGDDVLQLCNYANVADISEAKLRNGKPLVNCDDGIGRGTAPVASYQANPFGLYDMSGNVREWMQDCYHDTYRKAPTDSTARLSCDTEENVLRGGAWFSFPWINSSSTRQSAAPFASSFSIGFRLMRIDR